MDQAEKRQWDNQKNMPDENAQTVSTGDGGNDGGGTPSNDKGGDGAQELVKIGDKEYTPEQLTDYIKKATDYDALLPEFTKKSQALAVLLGGKPNESQEDVPSFLKPGWKPKDFVELGSALKEAAEFGEKRARQAIEEGSAKATEAKKAVDAFVAEVNKANKDFDQQEFFQYVERHHIRVDTIEDLKSVYSAYEEANADGKMAERRALANKAKRGSDSVSKPASAGATLPYDANELRVRSSNILDAAKEALSKLK